MPRAEKKPPTPAKARHRAVEAGKKLVASRNGDEAGKRATAYHKAEKVRRSR